MLSLVGLGAPDSNTPEIRAWSRPCSFSNPESENHQILPEVFLQNEFSSNAGMTDLAKFPNGENLVRSSSTWL